MAISWVLWALLVSLVMGWLAKSRHRARPDSQQHELVHPRSTLILGIVCFVGFVGFLLASTILYRNRTTSWWSTAIFLGFALMSIAMIADYFLARHQVSEEGMKYRKLTGASKSLRWSDLRAVRYAPAMKWFRLETQTGDVARVSVMLMGLPVFARLLLAHAPKESIDASTLPILEATAENRPPSVWV